MYINVFVWFIMNTQVPLRSFIISPEGQDLGIKFSDDLIKNGYAFVEIIGTI